LFSPLLFPVERYRAMIRGRCSTASATRNAQNIFNSIIVFFYNILHFTQAYSNPTSTRKIDTLHWNKNCSLFRDLVHTLHPRNVIMLWWTEVAKWQLWRSQNLHTLSRQRRKWTRCHPWNGSVTVECILYLFSHQNIPWSQGHLNIILPSYFRDSKLFI
jgi:hypothetical protein